MVETTVYENNQAAFLVANQLLKNNPQLTEQTTQAAQAGEAGLTVAGGLALGGIGGGGAAAGGGALGGTSRLLIGRTRGAVIAGTIGAFLAAMAGIPQNLIGKEFNKWASDNDIDVGNLRLNAEIQMYTTPIIDPVSGELTFLQNDPERLRQRMRAAGVPKTLLEKQLLQHLQERLANEKFIQEQQSGQIGEPGQNIQSQALAGETPIETLNRLQKETISKGKEQQKIAEGQRQQDVATAQRFSQQIGQPLPAFAQGQPQAIPPAAVKFLNPETGQKERRVLDPNLPASEQEGFRPGENFVKSTEASKATALNFIRGTTQPTLGGP